MIPAPTEEDYLHAVEFMLGVFRRGGSVYRVDYPVSDCHMFHTFARGSVDIPRATIVAGLDVTEEKFEYRPAVKDPLSLLVDLQALKTIPSFYDELTEYIVDLPLIERIEKEIRSAFAGEYGRDNLTLQTNYYINSIPVKDERPKKDFDIRFEISVRTGDGNPRVSVDKTNSKVLCLIMDNIFVPR